MNDGQLSQRDPSDRNIAWTVAVAVTLVVVIVLEILFPLLQSRVPYTAIASILSELSPCINLRSST